ncbi:hypothetical protein P3X46_015716 [Hevea brasiliensis]|uniref:CBM20 domain-containing protein n=2 Tax=Hevea brasiliensis TaxID=3981 RepID=A0ABQ9LWT5_HEVBR|nr:hypothetical protein P3X46_015716 [Hevea brasiliensis]
MFGDQFLLVGDDPILGLWNPTNAVPMNWSDGHIWSVELDVPIESTIQFKFIIKQSNGDMFWQPGPDRIFKSWESKGTVIIAEDWENPEAQKITEELHQMEELMPNINNGLMFSGNIAYAEDKLNVSSDFFTREGTTYPVEGHLNTSNESLKSEESVGDIKEDPMKKNNARALTVKNPMTVEDEENRFGYEDGCVLVPGLTPMQVVPREEALSRELGSIIGDASIGVDAAME